MRVKENGNRLYFYLTNQPSNLQQTAQQRILKALETMTAGESVSINYTTHSHHLINPRWLESTFIVKNSALNYETIQQMTQHRRISVNLIENLFQNILISDIIINQFLTLLDINQVILNLSLIF